MDMMSDIMGGDSDIGLDEKPKKKEDKTD